MHRRKIARGLFYVTAFSLFFGSYGYTHKHVYRRPPAPTLAEPMHTPPQERLPDPQPSVATNVRGAQKRALLVGIDYRTTRFMLPGCDRDVQDMQAYLLKHRGFRGSDIYLLTHENATKARMLERMKRLVRNLPPLPAGQFHELYMHFSGHGERIADDGDDHEADGLDDCLVACDFKGMHNLVASSIRDDDLVAILFPPHIKQRKDIKFRLVFDCCHSGTMLDNALDDAEADVCYLSGCQEVQKADDAYVGGAQRGAMSWSLLTAQKRNQWSQTMNPEDLLSAMHQALRSESFGQIPQLYHSKNCTSW